LLKNGSGIFLQKGLDKKKESAASVHEFQRAATDTSQLMTGNGVKTCSRIRIIAAQPLSGLATKIINGASTIRRTRMRTASRCQRSRERSPIAKKPNSALWRALDAASLIADALH